jgi:hypothetical protein
LWRDVCDPSASVIVAGAQPGPGLSGRFPAYLEAELRANIVPVLMFDDGLIQILDTRQCV